jgi:DNA-binding NarL/FixJ family response regulator
MMYDETNGNLQAVTERERKIIRLMAEGYKSKEIADELRMKEKTVKEKRGNLMRKFNARSTASVIEYALGAGLISVYEVLESRFSKRIPKRN